MILHRNYYQISEKISCQILIFFIYSFPFKLFKRSWNHPKLEEKMAELGFSVLSVLQRGYAPRWRRFEKAFGRRELIKPIKKYSSSLHVVAPNRYWNRG